MMHETSRRVSISFEFFPPKNQEQASQLERTARRLAAYQPAYVSVTYGAGGSSQEGSFAAVRGMREIGFLTAAHLTCADSSRDALERTIRGFRAAGIDRFVALRGDPPGGLSEPYIPHPFGLSDTAELVRALKRAGAAEVSVSAYPEGHPQSPDWESEIATLKRKVDAGADRAITQFFYDNDLFEAYVARVRRAGISIPIVPGIMPIHRFDAVCRFAGRCGTSIPEGLAKRFFGLDPDSPEHAATAASVAAEQVSDLTRRGVDAFHIYTLNRADLSLGICEELGIAGSDASTAAAA